MSSVKIEPKKNKTRKRGKAHPRTSSVVAELRNDEIHTETSPPNNAVGAEGDGDDGNYLAARLMAENTPPLESSKAKRHISLSGIKSGIKSEFQHRFSRNGKHKMLRCLYFTPEPYGFNETVIEESKSRAAGITPVQDEVGDIYLVVKKKDESGDDKLSRWPGSISYPKVSSETLGIALDWPEIRQIDKSKKSQWSKQLSMIIWVIVIAVLILIFFLGYFFLAGGGK